MKRAVVRLVVSSVLVATGVSSLGRGAWIYAKAELAQVLLAQAWRQTAASGAGAAPWPWADTWPVARLVAPAHDIDLIVLAGGSGSTMAFGPGHLDFSADPGRMGNCVLAGHRDTHFAFLERLTVGDELVVVRPDGERIGYRVSGVEVVDRDQHHVMRSRGGCELTLVTCFPFRDPVPGGRLRYVVHAAAVEPGECASGHTGKRTVFDVGIISEDQVAKSMYSFKIGTREGKLAPPQSTLPTGRASCAGGGKSV